MTLLEQGVSFRITQGVFLHVQSPLERFYFVKTDMRLEVSVFGLRIFGDA